MEFPSWLAPYRPQVPLKSLVEEINRIYHAFDAANYDAEHVETRLLWPELWTEMTAQLPERDSWRALDFGCGTGFATEQVLKNLGPRLNHVVAFDPSREMMARGKDRVANHPKVLFSDDLNVVKEHGPYNLLITNSVLHHLPDVEETLLGLQAFLSSDAYWLSGNEPSQRFYRNAECVRLFQEYAAYLERRKWLQPSAYIAKLKHTFGLDSLSATARVAVERGLFELRPPATAISQIVDFHAPQMQENVDAERGFDVSRMQLTLKPHWKIEWSKTYYYLGPFSQIQAPRKWRDKARLLKEKFPDDGANFCCVWSRTGA
jgi:SAM-dependent methyltransferase